MINSSFFSSIFSVFIGIMVISLFSAVFSGTINFSPVGGVPPVGGSGSPFGVHNAFYNFTCLDFPQNLTGNYTGGQYTTVYHHTRAFEVDAELNYTAQPSAFMNCSETDEFSFWAGDVRSGFCNDIEWGIVARINDGMIYGFLQVGGAGHVYSFAQKPIRAVDGLLHHYNVSLVNGGSYESLIVDSDGVNIVLSGFSPYPVINDFGLIYKSMRVSPDSISIHGYMNVTGFVYYG